MVVPGVASAVTNSWEPRDPEAALAWMDAWQDALPPGVQVTILDTLLFPKVPFFTKTEEDGKSEGEGGAGHKLGLTDVPQGAVFNQNEHFP